MAVFITKLDDIAAAGVLLATELDHSAKSQFLHVLTMSK